MLMPVARRKWRRVDEAEGKFEVGMVRVFFRGSGWEWRGAVASSIHS